MTSFAPVAQAGGCPTCTASSECTSFDDGGVAFCVVHTGDVGCGTARTLCCPGQGCSTFDGRPSCEGSTCTVIEDLVDGGTSGTDAGTSGTDAGTSGTDAGAAAMDGGGGGTTDAGGTTPPATSSCGCRAGSAGSPSILLVLAALVFVRRARR